MTSFTWQDTSNVKIVLIRSQSASRFRYQSLFNLGAEALAGITNFVFSGLSQAFPDFHLWIQTIFWSPFGDRNWLLVPDEIMLPSGDILRID